MYYSTVGFEEYKNLEAEVSLGDMLRGGKMKIVWYSKHLPTFKAQFCEKNKTLKITLPKNSKIKNWFDTKYGQRDIYLAHIEDVESLYAEICEIDQMFDWVYNTKTTKGA
jgi:hypothetical protein